MEKVFFPASVVVFGVSASPANLARNIVLNLQRFGFKGAVYAVGKDGGEVNGVRIHPTVDDVPTLADAARMLNEADARISAFLATASAERLGAPLAWKNLKREEKAAPLWAVLRHTVNHASYHRGQAAAMLNRLGGRPAATDLVRWAIERQEAGAFEEAR